MRFTEPSKTEYPETEEAVWPRPLPPSSFTQKALYLLSVKIHLEQSVQPHPILTSTRGHFPRSSRF